MLLRPYKFKLKVTHHKYPRIYYVVFTKPWLMSWMKKKKKFYHFMRSLVCNSNQSQLHPEERPWFIVFCMMKTCTWVRLEFQLLSLPTKSITEQNAQLFSISHYSMCATVDLSCSWIFLLENPVWFFNSLNVGRFITSNTDLFF